MKIKRKLIGILLVLCMVGTILTTGSFAEEVNGIWTDYAASSFDGGSGTKDDPYKIATAEQLALLASDVNSGIAGKTHTKDYFILTNDINLSGHRWIPIGFQTSASRHFKSFSGFFDGNGKKITGLYVDERGNDRSAGLFGVVSAVSNEPTFKDIIIEDATVYAGNSTDSSDFSYGGGVLAGMITVSGGSNVDYIAIKNCTVSGTVNSNMYAGGLVGDASYALITNCVADVEVTGLATSGGFVGNAFSSEFTDCIAHKNVSGGWSTGGFAGILYYNNTINRCAAYGDVRATDWNVGGFVGYTEEGIKISNSFCMGKVESNVTDWQPKAGGFMGTSNGADITNCQAGGEVVGTHETIKSGGFIGYYINGTTTNCCYDSQKNPDLSISGEGTGDFGISGKDTLGVAAEICVNYYGGHIMGDYKLDEKDPTHHERTCERCSLVENEAHNRLASCGEQTCTVCGLTWNAPHIWQDDLAEANNDATCYKAGTKSIPCKYCDEIKTVDNPDDPQKDGHVFENYVSNENATCHSNATETAKCKWYDGENCTAENTREIPDSMTAHDFTGPFETSKDGHRRTCRNDGCTATEGDFQAHNWVDGACETCGYPCTHEGGEATCTQRAVCTVCGQQYGELNPDNHSGETKWTATETTHIQKYKCCGKVTIAEENHTFKDGRCEKCEYTCTHRGGEATCTAKAVCTVCGQQYGELNPDNHSGETKWTATETTHIQKYKCCGKVTIAEENHTFKDGRCEKCEYTCTHTGGEANCHAKAVCATCGQEYGELNPDKHDGETELRGAIAATCTENGYTGDTYCLSCNKVAAPGKVIEAAGHKGGKATCTKKAVCEVCEKEYGDVDSSNHSGLEFVAKVEPTAGAEGVAEHWHCKDCDKLFADKQGTKETTKEALTLAKDNDNKGGKDDGQDDNQNGNRNDNQNGNPSGADASLSGEKTNNGQNIPKTGDFGGFTVVIILMLLSGAAALVFVKKNKAR